MFLGSTRQSTCVNCGWFYYGGKVSPIFVSIHVFCKFNSCASPSSSSCFIADARNTDQSKKTYVATGFPVLQIHLLPIRKSWQKRRLIDNPTKMHQSTRRAPPCVCAATCTLVLCAIFECVVWVCVCVRVHVCVRYLRTCAIGWSQTYTHRRCYHVHLSTWKQGARRMCFVLCVSYTWATDSTHTGDRSTFQPIIISGHFIHIHFDSTSCFVDFDCALINNRRL